MHKLYVLEKGVVFVWILPDHYSCLNTIYSDNLCSDWIFEFENFDSGQIKANKISKKKNPLKLKYKIKENVIICLLLERSLI